MRRVDVGIVVPKTYGEARSLLVISGSISMSLT